MIEAVIGSLAGGLLNNMFASGRQENAQDFSAQQFANRYQTTVKDMQAAGLNPMLAYGQGGGTAPTSSAASSQGIPDIGQTMLQAKMNAAQVANVEADTLVKKELAEKAAADASAARGSAWQSFHQGQLIEQQVKESVNRLENQVYQAQSGHLNQQAAEIAARLKNDIPKKEADRLAAVVAELYSQATLNGQRSITEPFVRNQLHQLVAKLKSETDLLNFDIKAVEALNNAGGIASQMKPIIDVLRGFIRAVR